VPGVVRVTPYTGAPSSASTADTPQVAGGLVRLDAVLAQAPDSDAALDTVGRLRDAVHAADATALVGGTTASTLDTRDTAARDLRVIVPTVLLVIAAVLAVLLRSIVAPVLLVASVALSVTSTVGVAALVFSAIGSPSSDPGVLLIGFVFLVALGVDYNIFLMTRAREESAARGTREGILHALAVTGGVITSAGLVLAATFGALAVLPLTILAQLAFLVAFGVLLDTLVVRTLTVPAAVILLGDRTWSPVHPRPRAGHSRPPDRVPVGHDV